MEGKRRPGAETQPGRLGSQSLRSPNPSGGDGGGGWLLGAAQAATAVPPLGTHGVGGGVVPVRYSLPRALRSASWRDAPRCCATLARKARRSSLVPHLPSPSLAPSLALSALSLALSAIFSPRSETDQPGFLSPRRSRRALSIINKSAVVSRGGVVVEVWLLLPPLLLRKLPRFLRRVLSDADSGRRRGPAGMSGGGQLGSEPIGRRSDERERGE